VKTLTVRLPEALIVDIESESKARRVSRSEVVRERLTSAARISRDRHSAPGPIVDLVGSVVGLPVDLSSKKKKFLRAAGYGSNRPH
jgi:hypothetical protein